MGEEVELENGEGDRKNEKDRDTCMRESRRNRKMRRWRMRRWRKRSWSLTQVMVKSNSTGLHCNSTQLFIIATVHITELPRGKGSLN